MTEQAPDLGGHRVFLVEDEAIVALTLKHNLEELGASVRWASNLRDAMAELASNMAIDLAIIDINLAGETSEPVLDTLIAAGTYTLICSGYNAAVLDERFQHLPCCSKPFTRAKLRRHLLDHADQRRNGRVGGLTDADR